MSGFERVALFIVLLDVIERNVSEALLHFVQGQWPLGLTEIAFAAMALAYCIGINVTILRKAWK